MLQMTNHLVYSANCWVCPNDPYFIFDDTTLLFGWSVSLKISAKVMLIATCGHSEDYIECINLIIRIIIL